MTPDRIAYTLSASGDVPATGPHARLLRRAKRLRDGLKPLKDDPQFEIERALACDLVRSISADWLRSTRQGRRFSY